MAAINRDVPLFFDEDPTGPTLVCTATAGSADLTRLQERAYQALLLMRRLEFDRPLPWTSQSLYDWFRGAVGGVRFRGSRSFCCVGDRVLNLGVGTDYDPGFPSLIEGLVHEARHADGRLHTCDTVPGIGFTRDGRPEDLGAFGVQYYVMRWIADHDVGGLDATWREVARARSAQLRSSAFCGGC